MVLITTPSTIPPSIITMCDRIASMFETYNENLKTTSIKYLKVVLFLLVRNCEGVLIRVTSITPFFSPVTWRQR